jgi:hypothetical protein
MRRIKVKEQVTSVPKKHKRKKVSKTKRAKMNSSCDEVKDTSKVPDDSWIVVREKKATSKGQAKSAGSEVRKNGELETVGYGNQTTNPFAALWLDDPDEEDNDDTNRDDDSDSDIDKENNTTDDKENDTHGNDVDGDNDDLDIEDEEDDIFQINDAHEEGYGHKNDRGEKHTDKEKAIYDNVQSGVTRAGTRFREVEVMDHTKEDATIRNVPEICVKFGKKEVNMKKMKINDTKRKAKHDVATGTFHSRLNDDRVTKIHFKPKSKSKMHDIASDGKDDHD